MCNIEKIKKIIPKEINGKKLETNVKKYFHEEIKKNVYGISFYFYTEGHNSIDLYPLMTKIKNIFEEQGCKIIDNFRETDEEYVYGFISAEI